MESVLNYLDDSVERNNERVHDMQIFLKENPLKSLQKRKINGKIYYYLIFRKDGKVKQEHLGNRKKIDLIEKKQELKEYNKRVKLAKKRYKELKKRNQKMKKVLDFALKVYNE